MKTKFFAGILLSFCLICFASCTKDEDETGDTCKADCTVITGKVVTTNNQPLQGMGFEVIYSRTGFLYSHTIKKSKATSDRNGYYDMSFYLKDDELDKPDGYFTFLDIKVNTEKLDAKKYIVTQDMAGGFSGKLDLKRDVVYDVNFYVPQKRYIPVTLKGFKPIQESDRFEIQVMFPWGYEDDSESEKPLDTKYTLGYTKFNEFCATKEEQTFENVPFALNEENYIQVIKIKNGVDVSNEDCKVNVSTGSPVSLTFEY